MYPPIATTPKKEYNIIVHHPILLTKEGNGLSSSHAHSSADQRQRMLETPVAPLICTMAVPTIISMLVTAIYNTADTYFVSQINTSASGAVGIVFSVMAIIQAVGFTVGVGSGSIASRLLGQGNREEANVYAASGILTALVLGVALCILGLWYIEPFMWILGSTDTIYPYALEYARYILLGSPVMILSFTMNNLMRWQGKANLAVFGLAAGGILNIVLDPLFIFAFEMGIGGAGLATLISQFLSMLFLFALLLSPKSDLVIRPRYISRSFDTYYHILKQGMPSFWRQGVLSIATMALNFNARIYGDAAVAALSIVSKVFHIANSVIIGFGHGFQPVLGFNYGAKRWDRVREATVFSLTSCTIILSIAAVVGWFLAEPIVTLFRDDPLVIEIGTTVFRAQCFVLPTFAMAVFSNMLFQAIGKSWRASLLAISRPGLLIPTTFLMTRLFGLPGLEYCQMVTDALAFLLSAVIMVHYFKYELSRE